jgi:hypothetical protein
VPALGPGSLGLRGDEGNLTCAGQSVFLLFSGLAEAAAEPLGHRHLLRHEGVKKMAGGELD